MSEKIIIDTIDTSEAEDNFIKLLDENKTLFLNGPWGSGKTEFIKNVESKLSKEKKMIFVDLWNIKDNRTVLNIAFDKIIGIPKIGIYSLVVFCITVSILMTDVINLGILTRFPLLNNEWILMIGGIIALVVAVFQFLKIKSDSMYISLLSTFTKGLQKKILVIDDFDRVSPKKQEEAYKMFNILHGKLPIIFIGDYNKIQKNEDSYLQKIIDRRIELPYVLHPLSIWDEYFDKLQNKFDFVIDKKLKKIFIDQKRNLRDQHHYNDYINLELINRGKNNRVQLNQQLFIIYLYLFHNDYYQKLLSGWYPIYSKVKGNSIDEKKFENNLESNIYYILEENNKYPTCFWRNKQAYFIFENISNLGIEEAEAIINDYEKLRDYLLSNGNSYNDFYKYVVFIYNEFQNNSEDSNKENYKTLIEKIENVCFELLLLDIYSPLLEEIPNLITKKMLKGTFYETILEKNKKTISYFEDTYLKAFDVSQKIYFFLEVMYDDYQVCIAYIRRLLVA